jgi:hypothetical protein
MVSPKVRRLGLALAVVRDLREQRAVVGPEELAELWDIPWVPAGLGRS